MPGKRISELTALSGAGSANNDDVLIFDTTANTTKRISRSQLAEGMINDLPFLYFHGVRTTDPTQRFNGDSLALGDGYLRSSDMIFRYYTSSGWQNYEQIAIAAATAQADRAEDEADRAAEARDDAQAFDDRHRRDVPTLLADTTLTYTAAQPGTVIAGDIIRTRVEGFAYEVVASGATDQHLTTAGGVKFYIAGTVAYCDSVNGNDANSGRLPNQAKATLAAVSTMFGGLYRDKTIWLARGSYWREEIATSDSNVSVRGYGSGRLPIIDARNVIAVGAWSKTGGYTNVYQVNWTPTLGTKVAPSIWEDGVRLTRVASIAAVDAAPGTYYASTTYSIGVAAPVYVHASDSGDPAVNTKEYQQTVRYSCIRLGDRAKLSDVRCVANQHDDGTAILGRFSEVDRCVFEDGTKHHLFTASGVVRDCWAWRGDPSFLVFGGTEGIAFIAYNTANARDPMRWERCGYVSSDTQSASGGGFYAHSQAGQLAFRQVQVIDCEGYQLGAFVSGAAQTESLLVDGGLTYNCGRFIASSIADATLPGGTDILRSEWVMDRDMTEVTYRGFFRPQNGELRTVRMRDNITVLLDGARARIANNPISYASAAFLGDFLLERMAFLQDLFVGTMQNGTAMNFINSGASVSVSTKNCLFQNWGGYQSVGARNYYMQKSAGMLYTGENNVLMGQNGATERGAVIFDGVTYDNATAYLAAVQPGNEVGSVSVSVNQVAGSLFRRDYFVDLDARTKDCVPRIEIKYPGRPLVDRWREVCDWVKAA